MSGEHAAELPSLLSMLGININITKANYAIEELYLFGNRTWDYVVLMNE